MEDIKVGDFVRTDSGEIFKVIDVEKGSVKIKSNYKEWIGLCCITKHSPNIIELIEVGDYLNGSKVIKTNCKLEYIDDDSDTGVNEVDNGLEIAGYPTWIYFDCEIETIVTKEQFKSVSYEV